MSSFHLCAYLLEGFSWNSVSWVYTRSCRPDSCFFKIGSGRTDFHEILYRGSVLIAVDQIRVRLKSGWSNIHFAFMLKTRRMRDNQVCEFCVILTANKTVLPKEC
jgi:hypothetical protein